MKKIAVAGVAAAGAFDLLAAPSSSRLNFLVFLVDDLGYMDIGANNPDCFYDTPNIDALARSGMRFTEGYVVNPVCSPSRYSFMTGKYPSRVDATNFFVGRRSGKFNPAPLNDRMSTEETTIADALKQEGYSTFFAGKWHLGPEDKYWPENQGFDINIGGWRPGGPYTGNKYFSPYDNPRMENGPEGEHLPQRLADETANFIQDNIDNPFFAYLSFYSVHTPLMGRNDLVQKYKAKAATIEGEEFGAVEGDGHRVRILQKHPVYAAMVEALDIAVGTVLDKLKKLDMEKNTVVIFTSDNGGLSTTEGLPTSNLPLKAGKGWVSEGGIRVPWLIRAPGYTQAGSTSSELICSNDLYPTVLSLADAEAGRNNPIDGVDLADALKGGKLDRDTLYWHYPHYSNQGGPPAGAIRVGDFKLVEKYEDGSVELYNLKVDIGEKHDMAKQMPEMVRTMREKLHVWYQDVDAKFLRRKGDGPEPWRPPYMQNSGKNYQDARYDTSNAKYDVDRFLV